MSASYREKLDRPIDRIRMLLGATDVTDDESALISDQHITAVLALTSGSEPAATALLADELVARFAQEPDSVSLSGLSVSWRERIEAWQLLAARMRALIAQAAADQKAYEAQAAGSGDTCTKAVW